MVELKGCKGCGSQNFDVETIKGYDFLICKNCGNKLVMLTEEGERIPVYEMGQENPVGYLRGEPVYTVSSGIYNKIEYLPEETYGNIVSRIWTLFGKDK